MVAPFRAVELKGMLGGVWLFSKAFFATPLGWAAIALMLGFGWLHSHDKKIASRVIENSKREATTDVKTSTQAHSTSLSSTSGVRSGYRRD